ncbi:GAF domain-containing sensor histidine kinase [Prauserella muralis]|uniref:GAF domain-containing sensor histidine kinase n=1 Tax=Prauserella muralis TaxID=588067 RepID=UPI001FE4E7BD|nr:GAF domain-containing sensor histidine kinase [Prauserella muralis]
MTVETTEQDGRCPECGRPAGDAGSFDDARRGQRRLAAIARAASSVADAASLSVTLDVVAREVMQATHIAAVQILRVEGGLMRVVGKAGFTDAEDFAERLEQCRRLGARMMFVEAFRTRSRIVVPHRKAAVLADPAWAPLHDIMGGPEWDSFVAVPLVVRGRAVGVLNAYYSPGEDPGPETLDFLDAMADQAAMAVDSADLLARSRHDAQVEERARLARELHDSVVQQVFSMRMQAKALRAQVDAGLGGGPDGVGAVADELLELAQNALADLRGLVLQLHPTELVGRGLASAVRTHAESVHAATGLHVEVEAGQLPELPTELAEDLYRITQEALHNVVKHAQASSAVVRLDRGDDRVPGWLLLEVCDDGVGLGRPAGTDAGCSGGIGLVSMRERAERWGGTLEVGGARRGTRVRARIPVTPLEAAS